MIIKSPKESYTEYISKKLSISGDDLTETEKEIINLSYDVLMERIGDIKILEEENRNLIREIKNLKSYNDDKDYGK